MACLDMYNNSPSPHPHPPPPPPPSNTMNSPRISFSNDFVESHHHNNHHSHHHHHHHHSSPASSDFEFSITNGNMLSSASADELFFKGRILPFKNNASHSQSQMQRTLRDELLLGDDEADLDFSLKPPKSSLSSSSSTSNRWKGFLGLKKSHIGSKKPEKSDASLSPSFDAAKKFSFAPQDSNLTKSPQDMVSNEGPSSTDMEMGI